MDSFDKKLHLQEMVENVKRCESAYLEALTKGRFDFQSGQYDSVPFSVYEPMLGDLWEKLLKLSDEVYTILNEQIQQAELEMEVAA